MKPSDHPEFFRLPPPEGRSRESSIVLSADGRFFHDGAAVEHPGMHRAFASWLARHPDNGRYILNNGYDWSYLTVEGPSRFVRAVRDAQGAPLLELLDGRELPLSPDALRCDSAGRLWVGLNDGEEAAFTPSAQRDLAPWLAEVHAGVGVEISGQFYPIPGAGSG